MHIEFRYFLLELLSDVSSKLGSEYDVRTLWSVPVEIPPRNVHAVLSTSIAFEWGSKLSCKLDDRHIDDTVLPMRIASMLVEASESCGNFCNFKLSIGGHGFLNCNITDNFTKSFFEKLLNTYGNSLFEFKSLFCSMRVSCEQLEVPKTWVIERINKDTPNNDEIKKLATSLCETKFLQTPAQLMALALLVDAELSVEPFLAGYGCKQNVPWLLGKFLSDSEVFIDRLSVDGVVNDYATNEIAKECLELDPVWFGEARSLILDFREARYHARAHRRPDMLLKVGLKAVHAFYRYYNHPKWRDVAKLELHKRIGVRGITALLRCLVVGVMRDIGGEERDGEKLENHSL